jgi:hypothetical protein
MKPSVSSKLRAVVLPLTILVFLLQNDAQADKVDKLVVRLQKGSSSKIRLSAALNLAKIGDGRPSVIRAFTSALSNTGNSNTLRGVAAAALGKLISRKTPKRLVAGAKRALTTASKKGSAFVKRQANKALEALKALKGGGPGGVYIDIGRLSAKGDKKIRAVMRKAIVRAVRRKARSWVTDWPGKKRPTGAQLRRKKMTAFHIDGSITALTARNNGGSMVVVCKVRMLMASYPEKSMFGFPSGGAQVTSSSSASQVQSAKEDCVAAVIEALVGSKIVPILKMRVP